MRKFFTSLRDIARAGFFFMLPVLPHISGLNLSN